MWSATVGLRGRGHGSAGTRLSTFAALTWVASRVVRANAHSRYYPDKTLGLWRFPAVPSVVGTSGTGRAGAYPGGACSR
ncbi:hypothetical protein GCM10009541_43160 [Micromonospora gifhornensis]|uniref:Uncharacterized protein n=1 Tax=Micromonospora gifhornensis TaxID=84594 RepID=A0ABQ4IE31_9ACTN|nr:hypothetical protein Vgi01_28470 [Micromonospora gifhornensis]